jgi:hypothetical protein
MATSMSVKLRQFYQLTSKASYSNKTNGFTNLLSVCDIPTLYRFTLLLLEAGHVAKEVKDEVRQRIDRDFTVNFYDAQASWRAMKRSNIALTGKYVLSFWDPLMCERYERIEAVAGREEFWSFLSFLNHHPTFRSLSPVGILPQIDSSADGIVVDVRCDNTTVRLIQSTKLNPLYNIAQFHGTHLMNTILFDHLIVTYPTLTFRRRGVRCGPELQSTSSEPGHISRFIPTRACGSAMCGDTFRSFSDADVACIPFDDVGESPLLNEHSAETVMWKLGGTRCNRFCASSEKEVCMV